MTAPQDHYLILSAILRAGAIWEFFLLGGRSPALFDGRAYGQFRLGNGAKYLTRLDPMGVPMVTEAMRDDLNGLAVSVRVSGAGHSVGAPQDHYLTLFAILHCGAQWQPWEPPDLTIGPTYGAFHLPQSGCYPTELDRLGVPVLTSELREELMELVTDARMEAA